MSTGRKFSHLISPHSVADFFQAYYEKQYLYIPRNDTCYYEDLLIADDIDLFFQNKRIPTTSIRIHSKGNEIPASARAREDSSVTDNEKVFSFLNQGYTIVIDESDRSIIKLIDYCNELESELKISLRANIYITPHNAQGFKPHYDDHDVFILQTTGTKVWRLYNTPIELPSKKLPFFNYRHLFELDIPKLEIELQQGDLLYIPRGMVHDALTTDSTSVHITMGWHPIYGFSLLKEIADLAEERAAFRNAVPSALASEAQRQEFKDNFQVILLDLVENLNFDEIQSRRVDKFLASKRSDDKNRFIDSTKINKINLNSILLKRKNILFKVEKDKDKIYVCFYGKKLDFPLFTEPSIKLFLQPEPFAIKDIGGLITNEGRIELATRFIQEGFLTIEHLNAEN